MEVLNGMIRQNATVAQDQTEYKQRFDSISQKFHEAEDKKDAVVSQISDMGTARYDGGLHPDSETAGRRDHRLHRKALVRPAGLRHGLC